MTKLVYRIECLWGTYCFEADIADTAHYRTRSDIEGLTDKDAVLEDPKRFNELLNEARIGSWDAVYEGDSSIEDAVRWSIEYEAGGRTVLSRGEEGYWPYGYDRLIAALELCDEDIKRLQ